MKEHASSDVKTRSSRTAVIVAAFISALLLSLLCSLFFNVWKYEVERITLESGSWQSRITGSFDAKDIEAIKHFDGIKDAVVNDALSSNQETVLELYFDEPENVFTLTPQIVETAGAFPEETAYHYALLAMYFIRSPQDTAPRLLFPLYLLITLLASFSLIMIIHHAFAVSMHAKMRQLGILAGIGATPGQIRAFLLREAMALCSMPLLLGTLFGIAISMGSIQMINDLLGSNIPGRHEAVFGYHPLVFLLTLLLTFFTIWVSAWLPALKLSRLSPMEAIQNTDELQLKRKRSSSVLGVLFGTEGELAGNALRAQRKALRTASAALIVSFTAFSMMQCLFSMSKISTRESYFEKYQDVWDIMITVKNNDIADFSHTEELRSLPGVRNATVYQKASAKALLSEDALSDEMKASGGFSKVASDEAFQTAEGWCVNAPIMILDNASFSAYCRQIGSPARLDGVVVYNQIRNINNPDFRHPQYMPYVKESPTAVLTSDSRQTDGNMQKEDREQKKNIEQCLTLPVLSYTSQLPPLREEYASASPYELVHFMPESLWEEIGEQFNTVEHNTYIRILAEETITPEALNRLEADIAHLLDGIYTIESENRIQENILNDRQLNGMMTIFGGFCTLLAIIGIGNIFSATFGFLRQREREFARYMSIGMTPKELRKMFFMEALVISLRPLLFAFPISALASVYFLKASYLEAEVFLAEAPFLPIATFVLAVSGTIALTYFFSWRHLRNINLVEVLRNDDMF